MGLYTKITCSTRSHVIWDIEWLNVSGCSVTSSSKDGLELLVKKWCRTLVDLDIGNTTDNRTVDWAVMAFVENEDVLRLR